MATVVVTAERAQRVRNALLVLLAVNSGVTDAIGFLCLGGAFTSVMTGNMVLLGLSAARFDSSLALNAGAAIVCFVAGCALGTRIAGTPGPDDPIWPPSVSVALRAQLLATTGYAAVWELTGGHPSGAVRTGLLLANAAALGMQSSTVTRFGVTGLSTTYLTGTLTTLATHLASGRAPRDVRGRGWILVGLIGGAVLGGALALHAPLVAPALQLGCVGTVIVVAAILARLTPDNQ